MQQGRSTEVTSQVVEGVYSKALAVAVVAGPLVTEVQNFEGYGWRS